MLESEVSARVVRFGPFTLDLTNRLLTRDGADVPLPPRAAGVLCLLVSRAGHVVSKQELLETGWRDTFVSDTSLAEAISLVRQKLGDDPQQPSFIQTVPRRGYRFVAALDALERAPASATPGTTSHVPGGPRPSADERVWTPWLPALSCFIAGVIVGVAAVALQLAPPVTSPPVVRLGLGLPAGWSVETPSRPVAITRAGDICAIVVRHDSDGTRRLALRRLDTASLAFVRDSDGAAAPFFSPDGRWIAFFARGHLFKALVAGGTPELLADAPASFGGTWTDRGQIVFAAHASGGLTGIAASGGPIRTMTTLEAAAGEVRHAWPTQVGRDIVAFSIGYGPGAAPARVALLDLRSARVTRVDARGTEMRAVSGDDFLLLGAGPARVISVQVSTGTTSGAAATVPDSAVVDARAGGAAVALADNGTRIAVESSGPDEIRWLDRDGRLSTPVVGLVDLEDLAVAPSGERVAGIERRATDERLIVVDLARGTRTPLVTATRLASPVWSSRGDAIAYAASAGGAFRVVQARVDGAAGPHELPLDGSPAVPTAWIGNRVVVAQASGGHWRLLSVDTAGISTALAGAAADELDGQVSPDGRVLASAANQDGGWAIVVRPFGASDPGLPLTGDGRGPVWIDAGTLAYTDGSRLFRVSVPSTGTPVALIEGASDGVVPASRGVTGDGRILVRRATAAPIVTLGWRSEMEGALAARRPAVPPIR